MFAPNKTLHPETPNSAVADKNTETKYLSSWKEIANYMGKGVRTVQRYEAEFALPVRRPAGKSRAAVVATRAEIDAWVDSSPFRPPQERSVGDISANDPELNEIHEGIREMHELRRQMHALRAETNSSLNLLLSGIRLLINSTREQSSHSAHALEDAIRATRDKAPIPFVAGGQGTEN